MKYYRIKVLVATEDGEGKAKTFWAENLKKNGNKISFDIVKKDGSSWHGKKGAALRFFQGQFDDVLQALEAEMNLKYGCLEVKDSMDKIAEELNKSFKNFKG